MALSMVTFNIGGGDGNRNEKKTLINKFLKDQSTLPSLLFIQENPWRTGQINKQVANIGTKYQGYGDMEATILYRLDVLKKKDNSDLQAVIKNVFKKIKPQSLNIATFKKRASFVELTEIATDTSFVVISWHGEHSRLSDETKKKKVEDLLKVIKGIHLKRKVPVILGGDFNIAYDKVKDSIEEEGFELYPYKRKNRKTAIDFFVVTSDVELSGVSAFGGYMFVTANGKKKQVFDHDPVQALITFNIEDLQDVSNSSDSSDNSDSNNISDSTNNTSDSDNASDLSNNTSDSDNPSDLSNNPSDSTTNTTDSDNASDLSNNTS